MTYDEAAAAARGGKAIRHPGMGKGWAMIQHGADLWARNPWDGDLRGFPVKDSEKARTDWHVCALAPPTREKPEKRR